MHEPFSTFTRRVKNKSGDTVVFYVQYRDPRTGLRLSPVSLDTLNEQLGDTSGKRISSKAKAIRIAQTALDRGLVFGAEAEAKREESKARRAKRRRKAEKPVYFVDYCKACWDFDTSDYIRRKNKEKPNSITRTYAKSELAFFIRHVEPVVPKRLRIQDFDPVIGQTIRNSMVDSGYSGSTISKVMQCIRTPLHQAYLTGLIRDDLADRIENVVQISKGKGLMTSEETARLLSYLEGHSPKGTYDRADFLMVATAVYTGMRQGEIRALMADDIHVIDDGFSYIHVSHSYSDIDGLKCTKGKEERDTTIPTPLAQELLAYSGLNPDGFIFFSSTKPEVPQCPQFINRKLYKAMEAIGISDKERRERNISFHSLRHYYVTTMSEYLSADDVMSMTGHKSLAMHEHYNHETESKLRRKSEQRERAMPFNFA